MENKSKTGLKVFTMLALLGGLYSLLMRIIHEVAPDIINGSILSKVNSFLYLFIHVIVLLFLVFFLKDYVQKGQKFLFFATIIGIVGVAVGFIPRIASILYALDITNLYKHNSYLVVGAGLDILSVISTVIFFLALYLALLKQKKGGSFLGIAVLIAFIGSLLGVFITLAYIANNIGTILFSSFRGFPPIVFTILVIPVIIIQITELLFYFALYKEL